MRLPCTTEKKIKVEKELKILNRKVHMHAQEA